MRRRGGRHQAIRQQAIADGGAVLGATAAQALRCEREAANGIALARDDGVIRVDDAANANRPVVLALMSTACAVCMLAAAITVRAKILFMGSPLSVLFVLGTSLDVLLSMAISMPTDAQGESSKSRRNLCCIGSICCHPVHFLIAPRSAAQKK
ncbi:hypothetical protein LP419_13945 [Massilia sp. H-1]|nr:hypothetical protein LP419_13945 [Massilia sp. H-1]